MPSIRLYNDDESGDALDNMVRDIVPPRPGQTSTLVLSRNRKRLRHLWDISRQQIDDAGVYAASPGRMELTARNGIIRFIAITEVTQVSGLEADVVAIDSLAAFTTEEIAYLSHLARSTSGFKPFIAATK